MSPRGARPEGQTERTLRVGIFGCPPSTGNKGVDALRLSLVDGLRRRSPNVDVTVFGYSASAAGDEEARTVPAYYSRRLWSASNLQQALVAARIGMGRLQPVVKEIRRQDVVLDVSGGDSFADIYGERRFRGSLLTKRVVLASGTPLFLPPQTYGPYRTESAHRRARAVLRGATRVWARDPQSVQVVRDLVGDAFDPGRHSLSVDVAFGLDPQEPASEVVEALTRFRADAGVLVALNVSGLLYNIEGYAESHFGFLGDYRQMIDDLVNRLLAHQDLRILVLPHVESAYKHDSDFTAAQSLVDRLTESHPGRTMSTPPGLTARQVKWAAGLADWACATRMHAAIASLSQGIPTVAVAYSDKTRGVFETAGVADAVVDPRTMDNPTLVESVIDAFDRRWDDAARLQADSAAMRGELDRLFSEMVSAVPSRA